MDTTNHFFIKNEYRNCIDVKLPMVKYISSYKTDNARHRERLVVQLASVDIHIDYYNNVIKTEVSTIRRLRAYKQTLELAVPVEPIGHIESAGHIESVATIDDIQDHILQHVHRMIYFSDAVDSMHDIRDMILDDMAALDSE